MIIPHIDGWASHEIMLQDVDLTYEDMGGAGGVVETIYVETSGDLVYKQSCFYLTDNGFIFEMMLFGESF